MLLFLAASEDIKKHRVPNRVTGAVCLLGAVNISINSSPKDRWETIAFTCFFLFLLLVLYFAAKNIRQSNGKNFYFGGADVKIALGTMLFFGWEKALFGMFFGLVAAMEVYIAKRAIQNRKLNKENSSAEIPLVPWIVCGMLVFSFVM